MAVLRSMPAQLDLQAERQQPGRQLHTAVVTAVAMSSASCSLVSASVRPSGRGKQAGPLVQRLAEPVLGVEVPGKRDGAVEERLGLVFATLGGQRRGQVPGER